MIGTAHQREEELRRLYPTWEKDTQWTWFQKNSRRFSDRVFLIDIDEDQSYTVLEETRFCENKVIHSEKPGRYTYRDMEKLVQQVSCGFYACGMRPGMMAAVDMANRKELPAAVFALSRLGCTAVMVNSRISDAEREYILKKADAKYLITDRAFDQALLPRKELMQILITEKENPDSTANAEKKGTGQSISWNRMLVLGSEEEASLHNGFEALEAENHDPQRTSMIMFTSGSTSHPKGVMLTDAMLLRSAFATANTRHMEIGRRIYLPIPLFHAMAYVEGMLAAVTVGGSIVISKKKADPAENLQWMQNYKVNDIVCISSVMIRMMAEISDKSTRSQVSFKNTADFSSMHAAYWAGACPAWVWDAARKFFQITDCGNGYGMTECGSTACVMSGTDPENKVPFCHGKLKNAGIAAFPQESGKILSVKIAAEDGQSVCRPGEAGEILFRGISVTKGYYREPEATAALFDEEGWLHSGDLGMMDEEGYLTFLGRKDDQFKVNGENVSPKFVEDILLRHSNVRYAEVVGIPHDRCGEAGAVFVEFYESREDAVAQLQEYIRQNLARFQQPAWIFPLTTSEWPKTSTGKVAKKALKRIALQNLSYERK